MSRKFDSLPSENSRLELATKREPEVESAPIPVPVSKSRPRSLFLFQGFQIGALVTLSLLSYFLISHYLLRTVKVVGSSMQPNLRDGDYLLLDRLAVSMRQPEAGEIVVIRDPDDQLFSIKRVIGKPGDSLRIKEGKVFLNSEELDETYLPEGTPTHTAGFIGDEFYIFGNDRYFLLGDNRDNSVDSRWYGPIPEENILGIVKLK